MLDYNSIKNRMIEAIHIITHYSKEMIELHFLDPLNDEFFQFDSITAVYLLLAIKDCLIQVDNPKLLNRILYCSPNDILNCITENKKNDMCMN